MLEALELVVELELPFEQEESLVEPEEESFVGEVVQLEE